jgi:hypothetical protein
MTAIDSAPAKHPRLRVASIAGIVAAVLVGALVLLGALFVYQFRRRPAQMKRRAGTDSTDVLEEELKDDAFVPSRAPLLPSSLAPHPSKRTRPVSHGSTPPASLPVESTEQLVELVYQRLQQARPVYEAEEPSLPAYELSTPATSVFTGMHPA